MASMRLPVGAICPSCCAKHRHLISNGRQIKLSYFSIETFWLLQERHGNHNAKDHGITSSYRNPEVDIISNERNKIFWEKNNSNILPVPRTQKEELSHLLGNYLVLKDGVDLPTGIGILVRVNKPIDSSEDSGNFGSIGQQANKVLITY
jgi:hypothetical protein